MSKRLVMVLWWAAWSVSLQAQQGQPARESVVPPIRFSTLDVILDTGPQPLAAYQLTLVVTNAGAKIVGIEGGESPVFKEPPNYDPKAIQQERVILAAFSTAPASQLPSGKTRIATIHLQLGLEAPPHCAMQVQVAAGPDGHPITCTASSNFKGSE